MIKTASRVCRVKVLHHNFNHGTIRLISSDQSRVLPGLFFHNRTKEIGKLCNQFLDPRGQFIVVAGPPNSGKSSTVWQAMGDTFYLSMVDKKTRKWWYEESDGSLTMNEHELSAPTHGMFHYPFAGKVADSLQVVAVEMKKLEEANSLRAILPLCVDLRWCDSSQAVIDYVKSSVAENSDVLMRLLAGSRLSVTDKKSVKLELEVKSGETKLDKESPYNSSAYDSKNVPEFLAQKHDSMVRMFADLVQLIYRSGVKPVLFIDEAQKLVKYKEDCQHLFDWIVGATKQSNILDVVMASSDIFFQFNIDNYVTYPGTNCTQFLVDDLNMEETAKFYEVAKSEITKSLDVEGFDELYTLLGGRLFHYILYLKEIAQAKKKISLDKILLNRTVAEFSVQRCKARIYQPPGSNNPVLWTQKDMKNFVTTLHTSGKDYLTSYEFESIVNTDQNVDKYYSMLKHNAITTIPDIRTDYKLILGDINVVKCPSPLQEYYYKKYFRLI